MAEIMRAKREEIISDLILDLHSVGAVKLAAEQKDWFTLASGMKSPIYIDLRKLVSHPDVMKKVVEAFHEKIRDLKFDRIAGIPYAALPIASVLSVHGSHPMIYTRKEVKEYGTKRLIEGDFEPGQQVLVIDDLITTAKSKLETIAPLEEAGLKIKDVAVLIDREQGGKEQLEAKGYNLHAVMKITELLGVLRDKGRITHQQHKEIVDYLAAAKAK